VRKRQLKINNNMKNFLTFTLTVALLTVSGCHRALWNELDEHARELEAQARRIAALEAWQATVNGNITALQGLVNALQNHRFITDVSVFTTPEPGGYTISFDAGAPATIWHGNKGDTGDTGDTGDKGDAGDTPQIGVREDPAGSGVYYWTLNGDWLLDGGQKIPVTGPKGADGNDGAPGNDGDDGVPGNDGNDGTPGNDGITPKLRINPTTNYWQVCTTGACNTQNNEGWENVLDSNGNPVKATGPQGEQGTQGNTGAQGPQGDAIFAENGVDNSHADYVEFTLADGTTKIRVPKYVPLSITFTQPGTFALGETVPVDFTVAGNVQSITAVDVPRGWTVTPDLTGKQITVTAPAAAGKYYTAAGTVTLLVSDGAERTITKPLALQCPAYVSPTGLGITFEQPGVFLWGDIKEVAFTTQGNATAVKVLDVPAGWTVAVAKSGDVGTFTITSPATITPTLEAFVFVSDAAGNTVMRTLELNIWTAPASTQTWVFGNRTWSDAIQIPECNKTDFANSDTDPQCRSYTYNGHLFYYYNWPYVDVNKNILCPAPWRVPNQSDFSALIGNTNYTALINAWLKSGWCAAGPILDGYYGAGNVWSTTTVNSSLSVALQYHDLGLNPASNLLTTNTSKYVGLQVRCVKDN
jgi:hypothetical protein